jgi:hypothetical protein
MPYTFDQGSVQLVVTSGATPGALLDPSKYEFNLVGLNGATQFAYPGNVAGTYLAGESYTFSYTFSQQFMLNQQNVAILGGRLTIRNFRVHYVDSAYFEVVVDPYGVGVTSETLQYVPSQASAYSGLTIGESALQIGTPSFGEGTFEFGVQGQSSEATITIQNSSPYPCVFLEGEWEADWTNRSQVV